MVDTPEPASDDAAPLHRPSPVPTWRERLERLADATGTTPARIGVGAAVLVVAVLAAVWLLRPAPTPPEASLPFASATTAAGSSTTPSSAPSVVVVDVAGAVVHPGLQELSPGARVADAITAAGGLTPNADGTQINLAAPLTDGERVYVVAVGEAPPPVAVGGGTTNGASPSMSAPVDLNTADEAALDALPGVGPATAAAIVKYRSQIGSFTSVDELLDVPGIGDAKLAALRDLVRVG